MKRRHGHFWFILTLIAVLVGCGNSNVSGSPDGESPQTEDGAFPEKPITVFVGFPAGGSTDLAARTAAEVVKKYVPNGAEFVIENKPGGGGAVAATDVVNATGDGYTLGFSPFGPFTLTPHYGNTTYSYDDIIPIAQTVTSSYIFAVKADAPWQTFEEWLDHVQEQPGSFTYGTPGARSGPQVAMEALSLETGMDLSTVPFEGNAPAKTALLGGHVDGIVLSASDIVPSVENGELRALLYFGKEKPQGLPDDVPTADEMGFVSFDFGFFFFGPKELDVTVRDQLSEAFEQAMNDPELIEAYEKLYLVPSYASPDELTTLIEAEYVTNEEIVKAAGLDQEE
ncbi:BH2007 [Halalkalibacterium halodurans C-125]|uniref:BH2007 protein n=1 Tax=Halalkalibacterium halodurans (strain ATCC BAA-125 / DSM 18197 / FERM 7344 / JCM 9153 / C-125) TaxID=272558 RepID=Q9KBC1_HALH5|nr:tripartite tricarboxylate transporter substrate binding protein [Halalkalibacterium halodurans]BAB05726.1 BH2007 [Halalkalibacterium halodurans C-125]